MVEVYATYPEGRAPLYASEHAAGADLMAFTPAPIVIAPGSRAVVPTGVRIALPEGLEAQVRPRSGLAFKHGITLVNSPGTIDADYRGEIKVLLMNTSDLPYTVRDGDRVAQLIVAPVLRARFVRADSLPETARGEGGFGSTGQ